MFMNQFEYFAPRTAAEVFELVRSLGSKAKILAGGTDLIVAMKDKLIKPEYLIDINGVEEFKGIFYEPGKGAVIGAATKIAEIEFSDLIKEKYFALHQAAGELGSSQVRHMATIGGNSCNASPAAETPTPLVALGAKVVIGSISGEREMPLEEFIVGNRKTALAEGEVLTKFVLPEPAPRSASRYMYMGRRDAMEIDCVNVAVNLELADDGETIKNIKFVMGSVSPRPLVSEGVPALLTGQKLSNVLLEKAAEAARGEAKPISDIRASAEYRREIVGVLTRRVIKEAYAAAKGV
ncbi:xanthine dehydrogenase, iron-sulfur clusterand FAD-binding subunit A [Pelotomaculum thermopropionicum SI]|uniref:Xanthine dehydrogenase, iron-sulfur clusterand FAD-binding subunit A n=1 Tax=Pelotomaculum thermopropionicum (strain DSM 13744 / JCM 10971 / SI) TaxID=370438 RepID=A5D1V6_PELTS|nr:xanthine dehydrogenase, iron-sulfur clusterand FAD-binding subunit A [Pelotomaculum thermopropionicum SI]